MTAPQATQHGVNTGPLHELSPVKDTHSTRPTHGGNPRPVGVPAPAESPTPRANPRGTSNGNCSGSAEDRRRRKVWLVNEFRADEDALVAGVGENAVVVGVPRGEGEPACRCYRCGTLLTVETVFVDRRIPGAKGGTYARNNIRPNCGSCSAITGNELRVELASAPACTTCGGRTKYRRLVNDHPCMSEFHGTPPTWRV